MNKLLVFVFSTVIASCNKYSDKVVGIYIGQILINDSTVHPY